MGPAGKFRLYWNRAEAPKEKAWIIQKWNLKGHWGREQFFRYVLVSAPSHTEHRPNHKPPIPKGYLVVEWAVLIPGAHGMALLMNPENRTSTTAS